MGDYIYPNEAEFQWSILIVVYPYITGLVAGAFVVSSLYHVFEMKALKSVARFALITSLAFLLIAPLPLVAHLGRPERAFLIFLTPHFTSAMAGFGFIWMCYLILVVVETWLVFRPDIVAYARRSTGLAGAMYRFLALGVYDVSEEALETDHKVIKILAGVGIPAAALLHGYVGFIFGAVKANPWWSTPLMPVIFLLSAIVSGIALLIALYVVSMKLLDREIDHECVRTMAAWLLGFLLIDLALEGLEILNMAYEAEESWEIIRGLITERLSFSFLGIQLFLGSIVSLVLLGYVLVLRIPRELATAVATFASGLVLVGVFAMRWNVVVGGQLISKSFRGYLEYEWIFGGREGLFMAALLLLLPLVLFAVLAKALPPWLEIGREEGESVEEPQPEPFAELAPRTTFTDPFAPVQYPEAPKQYAGLKLALMGLGATMAVLLAGVLVAPGTPGLLELGGSSPDRVVVPQVRAVFPASLVQSFYEPVGGSWVEPLDLTVMGERIFVLDHSARRIVEMDHDGRFVRYYDSKTTPGLELNHPHTMANDGTYVYIGNTFPPRIYVLDPDAGLERAIELPPGPIEELPTVPTGLAITPDGNLVVSDGQNQRLVVVAPDGSLIQSIVREPGTWQAVKPGSGENTIATGVVPRATSVATAGRPGGVGVTPDGTILALDILAPGVTRVDANGEYLGRFARPDDPEGGVFRPTDIAIDSQGRIYIADDLIQGVQVYTPDGSSLGLIGRSDPNSFVVPSSFERPSALDIQDDRLYVVDRGHGILIYETP